ncbi:ABC-2 type transport system ATP-binding protein [Cryobacterium psychrotolerans]|uniref:ABC-2 type transport system ATP-binding protein n=1 Tax=Cryobacterium psychrotolerans TaxID=386301 RepID=A0A1G9F225_9MICO|nr:ABC-2 type transport system ATP-binding protein [Cryobacterium psychrotolerans]
MTPLTPDSEPEETASASRAAAVESSLGNRPSTDAAATAPLVDKAKTVRKPPVRKPASGAVSGSQTSTETSASTSTSGSRPAAPKATRPAAAKPPAAKPPAAKSTVAQTAARTSAARTAAAKSDAAAQTGAARSTAAKSTAARSAAAKSTAAKSAAARSAAAKSTAAKSTAARSAAAKSAAAKSATTTAAATSAAATAAALVSDGGRTVAESAAPPSVSVPVEAAPAVSAPDVERARTLPAAGRPAPARSQKPSAARKPVAAPAAASALEAAPVVIDASGLVKRFGQNVAVSDISLEVRAGSFYGIVGPNGAGKTTTLSMITGMLRPDSGSIRVNGVDVWKNPVQAKRIIGVLPDRLRLFDRLTGAQLLYYSGILRGLDAETVRLRSADLAAAFGLEDALNRLVADYSAGMTKKIALACAMIHSPRVLVLDEPFESVDPVSAVNVTEILQKYVASGGTVVISSHGMDLIQRVCDHVAIIVHGKVLAAGTIAQVRGAKTLEERFVELAGGRKVVEGMEWLHSFSD